MEEARHDIAERAEGGDGRRGIMYCTILTRLTILGVRAWRTLLGCFESTHASVGAGAGAGTFSRRGADLAFCFVCLRVYVESRF